MKHDIFIILPVMNETFSLRKTAEILVAENRDDILEILIVIAERTTAESRAVIEELRKKYPTVIRVMTQTLPYLGGAMRDAFREAKGEWVLMMSSDLETDPH